MMTLTCDDPGGQTVRVEGKELEVTTKPIRILGSVSLLFGQHPEWGNGLH